MATRASTGERRGAIDLARIGALLLVVFGHLSLAVIDRGPDGALRGANLIALYPSWNWVTALAPMPVFFAAGGWANSTATLGRAMIRLRTLVGLGAVIVTVWSSASMIELLVSGDGGIVADGGRIATQPLWFLAAYIPFTSMGSRLSVLARRPVRSIGACLIALSALDLARFMFDAPRWIGWPGFFFAWGVPWLLGAWWRARSDAWGAEREWRVGLVLALFATAACVALVHWAGYSPALIDAVSGRRSNTTPPTLFTATAAIAQVGALMLCATTLDRVATRYRGVLDRAGAASVGIYVWHLTSLSLCGALLAAGLWAPTRLTAAWWWTRPLWFALVLVITLAFTALTERATSSQQAMAPAPWRSLIAVVMLTIGAATVGIIGPRTVHGALISVGTFVLGWWLLGSRRVPITPSLGAPGSEPDRSR